MDKVPFEQLQRDATAYQRACVLTAAGELDFFTIILENGNAMTAAALAAARKVDARATTVLLDALAAMGYLRKDTGIACPGADGQAIYSVVDAFQDFLDSRRASSFVPMLRHMANAQRGWADLARIVAEGRPRPRRASILGEQQDDISFIMGMNSLAVRAAGPMIEALKEAAVLDFGVKPMRILDVGGASGTYTQAFLEALPTAEAAIFDRPVGIAAARRRFTGTSFESRVSYHAGDFYRDPLPTGFDLAWISAIIHQHGRDRSRALYARLFPALNPGGRVAVRDFIMEADRTRPVAGALFGVNMLVHCEEGMVYTFEEVRQDLEAAGFTQIRLAVPAGTMSAVVVGVRA